MHRSSVHNFKSSVSKFDLQRGGWQMPPFDFMGPRGPYPAPYRMGPPPPNQVTSPQGQHGQVNDISQTDVIYMLVVNHPE